MSTSALDLLKAKSSANPQAPQGTEGNEQQKEKMYQEYKSSRIAMRIVTNKGIQCVFNGNRFFTDDEEVIAYLDSQIKSSPMVGIVKGELVPSSARDPNKAHMDALKAELKEQLRAELLAELEGQKRDFGNYEQPKSGAGMTTTANMIGSVNTDTKA